MDASTGDYFDALAQIELCADGCQTESDFVAASERAFKVANDAINNTKRGCPKAKASLALCSLLDNIRQMDIRVRPRNFSEWCATIGMMASSRFVVCDHIDGVIMPRLSLFTDEEIYGITYRAKNTMHFATN